MNVSSLRSSSLLLGGNSFRLSCKASRAVSNLAVSFSVSRVGLLRSVVLLVFSGSLSLLVLAVTEDGVLQKHQSLYHPGD